MESSDRFEFRLRDLGEGIHEALLLEWNVRPGDRVEPYQPLCQVESAKAVAELTSPVGGRIVETRVPEGATAQVGQVLVVIETAPEGDQPGDPTPTPRGEDRAEAPPSASSASEDAAPREYWGIVGGPPSAPPQQQPPRVLAAPLVRKMARDLGIRLEDVPGSGPQGRVRVADLEAYARVRQSPSPPSHADEQRVPLRGLRKRIADHMLEAVRRAPHVTGMDTFDVTDLVRARQQMAPLAQQEGVKLTYLPFVVKAAVEALRAVPHANASVDEQRDEVVLKRRYHLGVATTVPDGLVVPVLRDADRLSLLDLAREIVRLTEAARAGRAAPADLTGSTFTITSFGSLPGAPFFATPILNYPETAILGVGRVEEQPRVVAGHVVPRHCLGVSFTFDHRVLDGEGAAQFLATLRRFLEQPLELLLRLR